MMDFGHGTLRKEGREAGLSVERAQRTGLRDAMIGLVALAAAFLWLGCPSCPYEARCEGNVLHTCWLGVDQLVGSPARDAVECRAPNPVCVDLDDRNAQCVMDDQATCQEPFDPFCEEGAVVDCVEGYEVAEDCAGNGNGCHDIDGSVFCAVAPLTPCIMGEYRTRCDDTRVLSCQRGFVTARDCAAYETPTFCVEYTSEYGRSAYCY
ncbi:MAG: hypothetical protein JW797_06175 [Bradymonadales bacterium]|nr:hypothetical protein [Bradymonadales bacterium]